MSQAKKQNEVVNEVNYVSDSLVDAFWDQYELVLSRTRKRSEESTKAYVHAIKQTNKFNEEYRNMVKGFYEETKNTNAEVLKGFTNNVMNRYQALEGTKEVSSQWKAAATKYAEMAVTPIKQTAAIMETVEKRSEQVAQEFVNVMQEQQKVWASVTDGYVKMVRTNNKELARRVEDSFRTLVKN